MEFVSHSVAETEEFARQLAGMLKPGDCIAYRGGMGAGKTAFTRGLAQGMDLIGEVASPTFSIVNEYLGKINLYHFDMYRVESSDDLETTSFYDYLDSGRHILAVEWSENIQDVLPEDTIYITITRVDENTRHITVTGGRF